jgi:hypothetical protein
MTSAQCPVPGTIHLARTAGQMNAKRPRATAT